MADGDPLVPFNAPRRPSGAEQWQAAIETQRQRDLTRPSTGEQIGDIINHLIAGNPLAQVGGLYQHLQQGLDPLSPQAAGRSLWAAMSMAGAGMPYAQRGALGMIGGKPFKATRLEALDKLIANNDFKPTMREGRMWFRSLSPAENEEMNRIGWPRAPGVTQEDETSAEGWERNIRHWRNLADPGNQS